LTRLQLLRGRDLTPLQLVLRLQQERLLGKRGHGSSTDFAITVWRIVLHVPNPTPGRHTQNETVRDMLVQDFSKLSAY